MPETVYSIKTRPPHEMSVQDQYALRVFIEAKRLASEQATRDALAREADTILIHNTTLTPIDTEVTPDG